MRINYVIPTWIGQRRNPNVNYLKDHLMSLVELTHNLDQITIVRPTVNGNKAYYEIDNIIKELNCPVIILNRNSNEGQSYGQLFYAYEKYRTEFDYYIFVEDDYVPAINNFDSLLIDEYQEQDVKGYLCSYAAITPEDPIGGCSISNGIISTKYFEKFYDFHSNPSKAIDGKEGWMCHQNFAQLIHDCNLETKGLEYKYRVPYHGNKIIEYGRTDTEKAIFIPHQLYKPNIRFRRMNIDDINWFLDIRNGVREYLHNNCEFTYDDAIEWFNKTDRPSYYVIELGHKKIGYFRTSDVDGSLYMGCDLHKNYQGFGLAYKAYIKFIEQIKAYYGLKEIKLEVLSTNTRAINLYKKLGFKEIGIAKDKVNRNGVIIDSIIMKLDI